LSNAAGVVAGTYRKKRVLLVEDDEAIRLPLATCLMDAGCLVDCACSQLEVRQLLAQVPYDLAIVDLRLSQTAPDEGLDVIADVRLRDTSTPIVVYTASGSAEAAQEAARRGARVVLRKPQPLRTMVRAALRLMGVKQEPVRGISWPF
jgi:DNA-binding NtrC family response regulator